MSEPVSLTAIYQQDGPWIVAWIVEIPGVMTQGATLEEARANLFDALQLTLEVRREQAAQSHNDRPVVHREAFPLARPE
jgi:predicted RNase H-like HicB family nuclease